MRHRVRHKEHERLPKKSYTLLRHEPGKMFERPVVGALRFLGKTARRQFPHSLVISQAFTASGLFRAWLIRAIALFSVLFLLAIHETFLFVEKAAKNSSGPGFFAAIAGDIYNFLLLIVPPEPVFNKILI
jgi:hypothetical protein